MKKRGNGTANGNGNDNGTDRTSRNHSRDTTRTLPNMSALLLPDHPSRGNDNGHLSSFRAAITSQSHREGSNMSSAKGSGRYLLAQSNLAALSPTKSKTNSTGKNSGKKSGKKRSARNKEKERKRREMENALPWGIEIGNSNDSSQVSTDRTDLLTKEGGGKKSRPRTREHDLNMPSPRVVVNMSGITGINHKTSDPAVDNSSTALKELEDTDSADEASVSAGSLKIDLDSGLNLTQPPPSPTSPEKQKS